jgi:two-component system, chemotaxis family, chemotaxis protein CheV
MSSQTKILLETGTNEFEIVEFLVGDVHYGINVAKVREIVKPLKVMKMPEAPACVDGMIELRGRVMPLVNLGTRLVAEYFQEREKHIIICEFNQTFVGFLVNNVARIHRISWSNMEPVPPAANAEIVTGIIKMPDKLIVLLDFERILADVSPETTKKLHHVPVTSSDVAQQRATKTVLVAEDSKMLRELLVGTLRSAGYTNLLVYENGKDAWEALENVANESEMIEKKVQLVITDIEMPKMDGHHLSKRIKEHAKLRSLPIIIFSSLINDEMHRKGEGLGVVAQVSKPEIAILINEIDKHVL